MAESILSHTGAHAEKGQSTILLAYAKDILDIAIRRKWLIILCTVLGLVIGVALAWFKKDSYRSNTVILVEQQKIHQSYIPDVVGGSAAERVSTITQQVLSRTNLQNVIDEFHLYPDVIKSQGYQPVLENLTKIITVKTKGNRGQLESLTISYAHEDPMIAMKVTSKLASQYINENIKLRGEFIEGATKFLEQELTAAKTALDEKEKVLSEYKLQFMGELPNQLDTNLRTLDRLQLEKIRIQDSLNGLHTRAELLQKEIRDYRDSGALQQGPTKGPIRDPSVMQLSQLKNDLKKLSGEFTDAYPDVVSLKLQIQKLETELAQRAGLTNESDGITDIATFDPYLVGLNTDLKQVKSEIAQLNTQLKRTAVSMADFEGRIERTPEREQELLKLDRDYGNMQDNYQHLLQKRINARISENLDKRQKSERFRILDPANLPTIPEGIPRALIPFGGLGAGVGFGFGLAFLLDFLSPTFRRSDDVEISLGFPLLATIPSFKTVYGKSLKMLPSAVKLSSTLNGSSHLVGKEDYLEAGGIRKEKSSFSRNFSKPLNFPMQFNLIAKWRPQSVVAEQYRVAATRLDLLGESSMGNVVLITSAMKGEGKTSTASNLAYTLAQDLDEPILVIDCDYKCPNLHNLFSLSHYPGVADYLAGDAPLETCLQQIADLPLWCMAVGDLENSPVALSKLHYLSSLIELVKLRYRFIILDGPPVLPLADINVLSGLAGIVLMVVRSGVTPKDVVQKAFTMLPGSHSTRLVLSDAWSDGVPYYVRQGYAAPYSLPSSGSVRD